MLQAMEWAMQMFGQCQQGPTIFHLLHIVPEPQMLHVFAGVYLPPVRGFCNLQSEAHCLGMHILSSQGLHPAVLRCVIPP
jgi:hypothetical protein